VADRVTTTDVRKSKFTNVELSLAPYDIAIRSLLSESTGDKHVNRFIGDATSMTLFVKKGIQAIMINFSCKCPDFINFS
jgi:hypothetical protein